VRRETGRAFLDGGAWDAALGARTEEMVQMQRLESVVGSDAVARSLGTETRALGGLVGGVSAMLIGGDDQRVVA
jgi:hypothetical protein